MADETEHVETRLARVEEKVYSHDQRLNATDRRVDTLIPLLAEVATLSERQNATHASVRNLHADFTEYRRDQTERADVEDHDRKSFNRWAFGLGVTILIGLLSFAGILLTGGHP